MSGRPLCHLQLAEVARPLVGSRRLVRGPVVGALIFAALLVLTIALAGEVRAAGPDRYCCGGGGGGGGGGGCTTTLVYLAVFGGEGDIALNGTAYADGTHLLMCVGVTYALSTYQINTGGGYTFEEWLTSTGSVTSPTSQTTSFVPGTQVQSPTLALVLYSTDAPWAGYVYSGVQVTSVGAQFTIPTTSNCNLCVTSSASYWLGIGGNSGAYPFWQVGVDVNWYFLETLIFGVLTEIPAGGCAPCVQEWWQAWTDSSHWTVGFNSFSPAVGAQLSITVSTSGASSTAVIQDGTLNTWSPYDNIAANGKTGEWVEEQFPHGGINLPNGAGGTFTSPSVVDSGAAAYYHNYYSFALACDATKDGAHLSALAAGLYQFTVQQS